MRPMLISTRSWRNTLSFTTAYFEQFGYPKEKAQEEPAKAQEEPGKASPHPFAPF